MHQTKIQNSHSRSTALSHLRTGGAGGGLDTPQRPAWALLTASSGSRASCLPLAPAGKCALQRRPAPPPPSGTAAGSVRGRGSSAPVPCRSQARSWPLRPLGKRADAPVLFAVTILKSINCSSQRTQTCVYGEPARVVTAAWFLGGAPGQLSTAELTWWRYFMGSGALPGRAGYSGCASLFCSQAGCGLFSWSAGWSAGIPADWSLLAPRFPAVSHHPDPGSPDSVVQLPRLPLPQLV